jgi:hypothetical protein
MNPRYVGWVLLKSIMGSLLMFDSMLLATQLLPGEGITTALLKTGNTATCFGGFFLILSSLIGGFGIVTENYQRKGDEEVKAC